MNEQSALRKLRPFKRPLALIQGGLIVFLISSLTRGNVTLSDQGTKFANVGVDLGLAVAAGGFILLVITGAILAIIKLRDRRDDQNDEKPAPTIDGTEDTKKFTTTKSP